jgi:microcystin degradation protein MlrC
VSVEFGRDNVVVISPYLAELTDPAWLEVAPGDFKVIAIKSRVHFRRGFHDTGFAKTILLVEPTEPFLGTVRLDALTYRNLDLTQYYPFGNPKFP